MDSSTNSPQVDFNPAFSNDPLQKCKDLINQTTNVNENFTITNEVLYWNESELNALERHVRGVIANSIEGSKTEIVIYSVMFLIGLIGNIFVLISLYKNDRKSRRRENTLFIHLSLVDLLIVLAIVPVEVYWKSTSVWRLGNYMCKGFQFFKNYFM